MFKLKIKNFYFILFFYEYYKKEKKYYNICNIKFLQKFIFF